MVFKDIRANNKAISAIIKALLTQKLQTLNKLIMILKSLQHFLSYLMTVRQI